MSSKQPPIVPKRHSKTSAQFDFGVGFVVPFIPPEPSAPQLTQSEKLELQHHNKATEVKCLLTTASVVTRSSQISKGSETKRELQKTAAGMITIKTSATNISNSTGRNEPSIQQLPVEPETNQSNRALTNAFSAVKELFTTERNFLTKLSLLEFAPLDVQISVMFRDENSNSSARCLSDADVSKIFLSVTSIKELSRKILEELANRIAHWQVKPRLSDIFTSKMESFQNSYEEFICAQEEAVKLLNEQLKCNARFAELLARVLKHFDAKELGYNATQFGFNALLLEPVQRLPRYPLLLNEYYKNLDDGNPDREGTQKAIAGLIEVTRLINEHMWEIKCNAKLRAIAGTTAFRAQSGNLFQPGIKLRMFGPVRKIDGHGAQVQDRYLFLFTHKFFVCTESLGSNDTPDYKLRSEEEFEVNKLAIEDPQELQLNEPHYLIVQTKLKGFLFLFRDKNVKAAWKKAFLSVIDIDEASKRELKKFATQCLRCKLPFDSINRSNHCRICGMLICANCFYKKKLLMKDDEKICIDCGERNKLKTLDSLTSATSSTATYPSVNSISVNDALWMIRSSMKQT